MTRSLPPKSLVLYADDDPDDVSLLTEVLIDFAGIIELVCFPDGAALLAYVEALEPLQPRPSLIILDLNMPCLNGLQTLQAIRRKPELRSIPAVFFSTSCQPHDEARARQLGAGFITKPITMNQMQDAVEEMLEHCTDDLRHRIKGLRGG